MFVFNITNMADGQHLCCASLALKASSHSPIDAHVNTALLYIALLYSYHSSSNIHCIVASGLFDTRAGVISDHTADQLISGRPTPLPEPPR